MKCRDPPQQQLPTGSSPHAHPTQPSAVHRNYYYMFLQSVAPAASAPGGLILAVMICLPVRPDFRVSAYPETSVPQRVQGKLSFSVCSAFILLWAYFIVSLFIIIYFMGVITSKLFTCQSWKQEMSHCFNCFIIAQSLPTRKFFKLA